MQTNNGKTSPMLSYTDSSDYNNLWRLRAGASPSGYANVDGYYQRRSQYAEINSNASYQQDHYLSRAAPCAAALPRPGTGRRSTTAARRSTRRA